MQTQAMIQKRNENYLYELCVLGLLLTSARGMQVFQATTNHSHHSILDIRPVVNDSVMLTVTYRSCKEVSFILLSGNKFVDVLVTHDRLYADLGELQPGQPLSTVNPTKKEEVLIAPHLITKFAKGFCCHRDRTVVVVWKKSGFHEMSVFMQPPVMKGSSFFVRAFEGDVEAIHLRSNDSQATWNLSIGAPEINQYLTSAVESAGRFFDRRFSPSTLKNLTYNFPPEFTPLMMMTVSYRSCEPLSMDISARMSLLRLKVVHNQLTVEYWYPQHKLPIQKMHSEIRNVKYTTATSCTSDRTLIIVWNRLRPRVMTVAMQPPILSDDVFISPDFSFHPKVVYLFLHGGSPVNWTVSVGEFHMN